MLFTYVLFAGNCDALCTTYLKPMLDAEVSAYVQDWSLGGGLFLDFADLLRGLAALNTVSIISCSNCSGVFTDHKSPIAD